jgi:hypothetical protein
MVYLFAFAFGRHSAAAVVHLGLLLALVWQMAGWASRAGFPLAGICGAMLVFVSPMAGVDGTSAYNDVAVAAVAFSLFHALEIWRERPSTRLLIAIGLLAGFGYAAKYTMFLAVPYAIGWVAWTGRRRRDAAIVAGCALLVVLPWMLKDWFAYQNPFAPFFNQWFPNQHFTISFEREYRTNMAHLADSRPWAVLAEATTFGSLGGLLGPVFLLAPLGLAALRWPAGRRLLLAAAIFGAPWFANPGTRFLIPALPFAALAMAMVLSAMPRLAVAAVLLHAVLAWPPVLRRYCHADAWHLNKVTYREALRIKPEDGFLESNLPLYGAARLVERVTPPGAVVLTQTPIPEAYTTREIRTAYESAGNGMSRDILWSGFVAEHAPVRRLVFRFGRQELTGVRVVQTASGAGNWSIHEIEAFDGGRGLDRSGWKAAASPFPWGAEGVLDGRLPSFWKCGDMLRPGQYLRIAFSRPVFADTVVVRTAPDPQEARVILSSWDGRVLARAPGIADEAPPADLRRQASAELRRRGIGYLLVFDGEFGADDLRTRAADWGIEPVSEYKGARIYRLP